MTEEPGRLYGPWGRREPNMTEQLNTHTCAHTQGLKQNPLRALTNVY